jgi:hypothetical protein
MTLDGVTFARAAGMEPDGWQASLLRSPMRQLILNCSRQSGKSSVSSVLGLHTALYQPEATVLLLAPALRQAQELFRKIKTTYTALSAAPCGVTTENALEYQFDNGSRILCLPGSNDATIRGFSAVTLLIVDEASRVVDALYQAIRPMLATSGGRIVLLSTPWGKRGFFFQEWSDGGPNWHRVEIPATACPRIPAAFLEEERRSMPDMVFRSEYLCQFTETLDSVFAYDDVMGALSTEVEPLPW